MTSLSPQQKLVLEAVKTLEAHTFLAGSSQASAENAYILSKAPNLGYDSMAHECAGVVFTDVPMLVEGKIVDCWEE